MYEPADADLSGGDQHLQGPHGVHMVVLHRAVERVAHSEAGEMEDRVDAVSHCAQAGRSVGDVPLDHPQAPAARGACQVPVLPVAEVVEHRHIAAGGDEDVDQVRADEPGTAGHQHLCVWMEDLQVTSP
jgi:hypothetical protein